jgi:chromate transporter
VTEQPRPIPTTRDLFFTFLKITLLAFGGAIAWVHRAIVVDNAWLSEEEFAETLSLCQFIPGPNITNFAVVIGMRFRGVAGAVAGLTALILPPMILLIVVGALYEHVAGVPAIRGALHGLSAAAVGLFLVLVVKMIAVLWRGRPAETLPVVAISGAGVATGVLSIPVALLVLAPVSIAIAWFRRR